VPEALSSNETPTVIDHGQAHDPRYFSAS